MKASHQWRAQGLDFDELVIGEWFHIEAMGRGGWFIEFCGRRFWVHVGKDGKAKMIDEEVDEVVSIIY